jgi:hypothetical protein
MKVCEGIKYTPLKSGSDIWKEGDLWMGWDGEWYPVSDWIGNTVQGTGKRREEEV